MAKNISNGTIYFNRRCTETPYGMTQTQVTSGIADVGKFKRVKTKKLKSFSKQEKLSN
jgi:hypothetical protein